MKWTSTATVLGKAAVSSSKIQSAKGLPGTFGPKSMSPWTLKACHELGKYVVSSQSIRRYWRIEIGGQVCWGNFFTLVRDSQNTLVECYSTKFMWDTFVRHLCGTLLRNTPLWNSLVQVRHCYRTTLLRGTLLSHPWKTLAIYCQRETLASGLKLSKFHWRGFA